MIVPIATEAEWISALRDVPAWRPPPVPTVVLAPHPDDETLAAGGLISALCQRRIPVSILAVTDGENAYQGEAGLGPVRDREQADALQRLGVPASRITRMRLPDSGVSALEDQLTASLDLLLAGAEHIIAPWPHDFHPDHEVTGRAALSIAQRHSIPLTFYFFWTWHRGTSELLKHLDIRKLPLTPGQQQAKREALAFHVSQLRHCGGEPILPENLLEPAWRPYEIYLPA